MTAKIEWTRDFDLWARRFAHKWAPQLRSQSWDAADIYQEACFLFVRLNDRGVVQNARHMMYLLSQKMRWLCIDRIRRSMREAAAVQLSLVMEDDHPSVIDDAHGDVEWDDALETADANVRAYIQQVRKGFKPRMREYQVSRPMLRTWMEAAGLIV